MKCDRKHMLLYAVTDRAWVGEQTLYAQVEEALKGGVSCVQLREKDLDGKEFLQEARDICKLCHRYGIPFIVNDNVEIAVACGADGIHVGQEYMSVDVPVVAIGGINRNNIKSLSGSGVDGVALVSAIFSAADIEETCRELRVLAERMVGL